MQWEGLFKTLKNNPDKYIIWLLANLGGLIISYLAAIMIWLLYHEFGNFLPGTDIFLITGATLLAVTMVSYQETKRNESTNLWIGLYIIWPFLLMIVFGFFLAKGIKDPTISQFNLWILIIAFFMLSILWSSIVWLHERGLLDDKKKIPDKPLTDPKLSAATNDLPKVPEEGTTV